MNQNFEDLLAAMKNKLNSGKTADGFDTVTTKLANNIESRIIEKASAIITEEVIIGSATTKTILGIMGQSAERRKQVLMMQQCVTCVAMAKGFISVGLRCIASYPGMKQDVVKKLGNSIFTLIADTMDKYLESMLEDDDSENNKPETAECEGGPSAGKKDKPENTGADSPDTAAILKRMMEEAGTTNGMAGSFPFVVPKDMSNEQIKTMLTDKLSGVFGIPKEHISVMHGDELLKKD